MCEELDKFCLENRLDNFQLHTRLKHENINNSGRWNEVFIREELSKHCPVNATEGKDIGDSLLEKGDFKVYVCGPPAMSETF